jgi:hypothetical protein
VTKEDHNLAGKPIVFDAFFGRSPLNEDAAISDLMGVVMCLVTTGFSCERLPI